VEIDIDAHRVLERSASRAGNRREIIEHLTSLISEGFWNLARIGVLGDLTRDEK
jgi:hypothetical protein